MFFSFQASIYSWDHSLYSYFSILVFPSQAPFTLAAHFNLSKFSSKVLKETFLANLSKLSPFVSLLFKFPFQVSFLLFVAFRLLFTWQFQLLHIFAVLWVYPVCNVARLAPCCISSSFWALAKFCLKSLRILSCVVLSAFLKKDRQLLRNPACIRPMLK